MIKRYQTWVLSLEVIEYVLSSNLMVGIGVVMIELGDATVN